ncbi:uncharacterized protein LTR77_000318 [Saxophila tyrrhenica]|uniref:Sde2 ubiquitin domain-containing protein n=1 Tax=Saxophila tyrrhenica TaxID=1690608 RepID=A0AAV9PMG6_9PEZI|nr:hypothetical protein LTR77_000318 [Saxophila tyrrhenica]
MFHITQPWELEAAYRKGWQKGLIASNPDRIIKINLSSFSVPLATLGIPCAICLQTKQSTSVHDVVSKLHSKLPDIPYPFTIATLGKDSRTLEMGDERSVSGCLADFTDEVLTLRLNVRMPPPPPRPAKKGLRSRLKSALGAGESSSAPAPPPPPPDVASAPPPYDEAVRSGR